MSTIEVKVPDIGDFSDIPVITVFVNAGDTVAADDPLIELESDKATMEVPSPAAGKVKEVKLSAGDRVSEGSLVLILEAAGAGAEAKPAAEESKAAPAPAPAAAPAKAAAPAAAVDDGGFATAHASPSVRAFARQLGADIGKIKGT
ncbi:MAG: E3 binding domain-containing protein, partial [Rhodobacteraceae bacterium]|nr:E3 binding domain-containing protein [Paracoccaceae bacterium]